MYKSTLSNWIKKYAQVTIFCYKPYFLIITSFHPADWLIKKKKRKSKIKNNHEKTIVEKKSIVDNQKNKKLWYTAVLNILLFV